MLADRAKLLAGERLPPGAVEKRARLRAGGGLVEHSEVVQRALDQGGARDDAIREDLAQLAKILD